MKKPMILAITLLLTIGGAYQAQCQDVTLGDATFGSTSDQVPTNSYWPMPHSVVTTFEGFGDLQGFMKTEVCHTSESVAGVKALRWQVNMAGGGPTTPAFPPKECWLARDTQGDLRVLKQVRAGLVVFEATATNTPPVFLPANITAGQSWTLFQETMTVEEINASVEGYQNLLKLKIATAGLEARCNYYRAGTGPVVTDWKDNPSPSGSGWRLKQP